MSTSPISMPSTSSSNPASSSSSNTNQASGQAAMDALGNPDTFLQLLVAQLQYQDPQSPADGTTFVTQLATFAGVEEQSAMRSDLDSINTVAKAWSGGPAALASAASSSGTAASNGTSSGGTGNGAGSSGTNNTTPASN